MPADFIYPDFSSDKFDIQYARRLGLSSDLAASIVTGDDGSGPVITTPSDDDTGMMRFGVAGEDDSTIGDVRTFDVGNDYFDWISNGLDDSYWRFNGNSDGIVIDFNIQDDPYTKAVLGNYSPGFWTVGTYASPGGNMYLQLSSNSTGHTGQWGAYKVVAGTWLDYKQEAFDDGTAANSYWYVHRELWSGGPGISAKILVDNSGISLKTTSVILPGSSDYKGLIIKSNQDIQIDNYPSSRSDGSTSKALYVDATGNLKYGTISSGSMRFGYSGEDDTGGESRQFDATIYNVEILATDINPLKLTRVSSSAVASETVLALYRDVSAGAIGTGVNLAFLTRNDSASFITMGNLDYRFLDPTAGAEQTYLQIVTLNAGAQTTPLTIYGDKHIQAGGYGSGLFTGTPAYNLQVDASGNIIEGSIGGGGNTIYTADDSLVSNRIVDLNGKYLRFQNTGGFRYLDIDPVSKAVRAGELDGAGNNTAMEILDATSKVLFYSGGNNIAIIQGQTGGGVVGIGNFSSFNSTRLDIVDNSVGANSIVNISTTSTAADSGLQKGLNVSLSGANANNDQSTYGIYGNNTHTGGGLVRNYAIYGTASGGTLNYGVYGDGTTIGTYGNSPSGVGVWGQSNSGGVGGHFFSGGNTAVTMDSRYSSTNDVQTIMQMFRSTTGTAASGLGGSLDFILSNDAGFGIESNKIISKWSSAANTAETSQLIITGINSAVIVDLMTLNGDGSWQIRPITATAASAITPAEGMFVFVSNTNGTFTSIGPWCYYNGAWNAL